MTALALAAIVGAIGWLGLAVVLLLARLQDQPRFEDRKPPRRHYRRSLVHPNGVRRRDAVTVTDLTAVRPESGVDDEYVTELHQMVVDLDSETVRLAPIEAAGASPSGDVYPLEVTG
jgi:hypothetical protein